LQEYKPIMFAVYFRQLSVHNILKHLSVQE